MIIYQYMLFEFNYVFMHSFTFARAGYGSESEVDDEAATVSLVSDVDKLNRASRKSAVRLQEIGPRMTMRLVRVESGLCSGDVLYPEPGELCLMLSYSGEVHFKCFFC
jgi:hypothetical protein